MVSLIPYYGLVIVLVILIPVLITHSFDVEKSELKSRVQDYIKSNIELKNNDFIDVNFFSEVVQYCVISDDGSANCGSVKLSDLP